MHFERNQEYKPRPNQKCVIESIVNAVRSGRKKLLLYAVMRFGKSNVAIWAAKKLGSKLTVILTGKADVKTEWEKTVESHQDFENFVFTSVEGFTEQFEAQNRDKNIVVFTTLQDLAGSLDEAKCKHKFLFKKVIDLLVIDETHFGARASIYGQVFRSKENEDQDSDIFEDEMFDETIKNLNNLKVDVQLHLSGTPYRILLSGEFSKKDIVGQVQFTDILEAKQRWIDDNHDLSEEEPWKNDYFGFPEMVRFAFTPNKSSIKMLESLENSCRSADLNTLFQTESKAKSAASTTQFKYESNVLDLLKAIDGSEEDEDIFPFLNYKKIKEGNLTQHMVFVLPYKNSVDAMERLLNKENFLNLGSYKIFNVAGNTSKLQVFEVSRGVTECANNGQKTITLTVNKMLTGSTIPEWDTMIFFKETKSPQEYDQAIYRLQSPWIKNIIDTSNGEIIGKEDMKPQTLLVDFSPNRMFQIESERTLLINAVNLKKGNSEQEKELSRSFEYSPIIYLNKDKLVKATPTNVIEKIREFSLDKTIVDEARNLMVDQEFLRLSSTKSVISSQPIFGEKAGFKTPTYEEDDTDLEGSRPDSDDVGQRDSKGTGNNDQLDDNETELKDLEKRMQTYYSRIMLYAFLSPVKVKNLVNIIDHIDEHEKLARHLGLDKNFLIQMHEGLFFSIHVLLDNKIENISELRDKTPKENFAEILSKLGNISENEIITPKWVAELMVDSVFTHDQIEEYKKNPKNIIDLCSKSGVFLMLVYQKLRSAGVEHEVLKDRLFAVATSEMPYEFTRFAYETFNWNIDHLVDVDILNSYQLINDESVINKLIKYYGDENMKFDVVIGNPPFQNEGIGEVARDEPIYNKFMDQAYKVADKGCFISPGRFLFNAGQTPKAWNEKMLNDKHLKVEFYEQDSSKVFPNTDIKGGVAVTYRDVNKDYGAIGIYTAFSELNSILSKVINDSYESLNTLLFGKSSYKFTSKIYEEHPELKGRVSSTELKSISSNIFRKLPEVFFESKQNNNQVRILGREDGKRVFKWIEREYIENHPNLEKYKVVLPASNGTGVIGEVLSTPLVVDPLVGHTQTFVSFGIFEDRFDAENLLKYVKSKFLRLMLGTMKVTQHNQSKEVWKNVPLQDFSSNSDIDWSRTIHEIDQQLYTKYGLNQEEINFIESKVKEMK